MQFFAFNIGQRTPPIISTIKELLKHKSNQFVLYNFWNDKLMDKSQGTNAEIHPKPK